ncbi:MAG: Spermidine/putrescine-binding periplasmic protein [Paracidovorax wautersii]|uniref:Spermidine/putrescine-binding periplasmic protein n=1 Tax=Paracidovorax wautersii TaxID=1177982 RepID=A0A7V8FNM8_9BURK|nr:MAG: Spermidine/putrescine-binding periplasmic protein [Paracidovorax wautersii]
MAHGFDRRTAIKGLALGGSALLGWPALAQQGRLVVGTWGGDYAQLLSKNIETPLLKPLGLEVVQDQAADAPRRSKLLAERRLPRGGTDVQALSGDNMFEMNENGALLALDYARLPNAAGLIPSLKYAYGVGQIYSGKVIVFNPQNVTTRPASFKDAFDPKFGSKLGFIDIQHRYILTAASLAATGGTSMTAFEPAKALLLAAKKGGARIYPTNEAFAQALKSGEIDIGIMWKARAVQWQKAGIACDAVAASEGIPMYISGFAIPKNAPNKDGAYAYLNAALDPAAQLAFATDMGYNPSVSSVVLPPDLRTRVGFTPEEEKRLLGLDFEALAKNDAALKDWWDKVFKA